jgi:flagellar capping protein FliD
VACAAAAIGIGAAYGAAASSAASGESASSSRKGGHAAVESGRVRVGRLGSPGPQAVVRRRRRRFSAVTGIIGEYTQAGGFLSTFKTQLTQQSSSLDRQIAAMQDRLAIKKPRCKGFSAADDLISQLQSRSSR